ncbi:L-threonine dehydratase biosynthetic IlvA [compost metagenome]|uniref:L-threonine dehydratase n=1 Tax=Pseudomonas fluorescens TaxID=294 RepID=A0A5E7GKX3_PSEFL|nr:MULTISPECIES: threonine ammonia-lyase, biosynthetic [Pseudomonas]MBV7525395.1 threonine ammonia-lyase, biosynthetic [Pseudomonas sp. PDM29]QHF39448.1 threonine ammonia-lyase, biosynthetic [Pseudomonas sp. S34]VVM39671.1 L-threonine dehydratase biosynthetic IlvA [Pseudomonas fluorescens]VVN47963.1 L-threonine dehydratase biosynthetic IlvA [Pseudomonas fluorescens]VVO51447.1 L-threonine dehydratase biosynthetic IlvA [Pseudomonas fluorescens]
MSFTTDQQALLEGYVKKILAAPVYELAVRTPLQPAPALSEALGNQILLKREDLQPTFSFKIRGAYNKLVQLSEAQKARGVVTASAGNHAQGVALAARELGINATIVMPCTTPQLKVIGVRSRGADAVLHGESFPFALACALDLARETGRTFVSPFDDPEVIAGQGTVAMEILRQHQGPLDAIFVPVGGGGLIAGIAAYVKYLRPEVRVIGVESEHSACLQAAMHAGERVVLPSVGTFADGVAVAQIGAYGFEVCRFCVDDVVTVSNDELCAAIKNIYDDTRSITEPSGALAVAGIKRYVAQTGALGQTLVAIDSGANINFDSLGHVAERAALSGAPA